MRWRRQCVSQTVILFYPMTNQKVTSIKFKGQVYLSPAFSTLKAKEIAENTSTTYRDLEAAFKHYWATGYHPEFGKDAAYARPKEILALSVRHVHHDNGDYVVSSAPEDFSATNQCWHEWKSGTSKKRPSSDAFVVYTVTDKRDALLISYMDANAHSDSEKSEMMEDIIKVTYKFHEWKRSKPMPLDDHLSLFDDKWLED
ncbi:Uncharacterised protein [Enterobacter hormaechei]|nr:Uncharacterised protein [Enterobacter hormaechei]SAA80978.1 Uncharacterised protein [Enterobacter hormaechei]